MAIDGKTCGLALSGGGFRATLFGLGSLWRLNDAGLLGKLDRITSVSGGSVVAGILAHSWHKLEFGDGKAANFAQMIALPVQELCERTIDIGAGLKGALTPFKSAGDYLRDAYAKHLFDKTKLRELPDASRPGNPKFIFYATNLQTGRSFRFRQDMLVDYILGVCSDTDVTLAFAVAASSAFPPVFSPIELETDPAMWSKGADLANIDRLRASIVLADGGVYDNMGLESLVDNADIVLVSDAGARMEIEEDPDSDIVGQMGRVRDILIEQTRALRKRWLVAEFEAQRKRGAYWGIGTRIEDYADAAFPFKDTTVTDALAKVPTRLARFDDDVRGRLVNWGYALCDVALRTRAKLAIAPATALPLPQWKLG
ncbi:MAG: patatin-like phospholipase family protein [Burkholderiales bacterium]|nr:patatin-like phospholipase family protein [Burkholderiales bacterium]